MIRVVYFLTALLLSVPAWADEPRILATIKPLHSLVQGVLGDTAKAQLLLDNTASPHDFQMKPSQLRAIYESNIVFYIDADFEQFLQRVLPDLPADIHQVAMARAAGITLENLRDSDDDDDHDHDHDHGAKDYHIWLDPTNASKMVQTIAATLTRVYPQNSAIYNANADTMIASLTALNDELQTSLAPIKAQSFIVFHDAYGYFERAYNLTPPAVIALDPSIPPSPKRIRQIRETLTETGAKCMFREPQFSDKVLAVIRGDLPVRIATLDPLGADLPSGAGHYETLLRNLAGALKTCLATP